MAGNSNTSFDLASLCDLMLEPEDSTISGLLRDDLDLLVANGDLAVGLGVDILKASLIRRIRTPLGHYGILVGSFDDTGAVTMTRDGTEYGADLGKFISEGLTNEWIRDILGAIAATLEQETRITVTDVTVDILDPAHGVIQFNVQYSVKDSGNPSTLTLVSGENFLNIT